MALRDLAISLSPKTSTKVLKILILGGNHPTEHIVLLLDEVTKSGILSFNICLYGGLLLLNGPKGSLNLAIIS